jgi:hypothetical protein
MAGFGGGSVATWEPFAKPLGSGRALVVSNRGDYKAHDKEVVGLAFATVNEAPDTPVQIAVSVGATSVWMGKARMSCRAQAKSSWCCCGPAALFILSL